MAQNKLYGVVDGASRPSINEYEVSKETPKRYYIKGANTSFVDKATMWAFWGESYFTTEREAARYLVEMAQKEIEKAKLVIERNTAAIEKYRPLAGE